MSSIDLYDTVSPRTEERSSVLAGLKRLWTSHNRKRAERKAERKMVIMLSQLDDHLLRDIGIEPQDLISALNGGRAPSILFNPMRRG
jgi:uncharacterized protein YjiS (DUF1127 family)